MRIVNLTPHEINFILEGKTMNIPSSGVARCEMSSKKIGRVGNLDVYKNVYGNVSGLPEEKADTIYIVSALVAQAVKGLRSDCYVVNDTVRDESGRIIGCRSLAKI